jgi:hypothetical protein
MAHSATTIAHCEHAQRRLGGVIEEMFDLRSRYEITWPFVVISLRLLMPFWNLSGQVIL